MEADAVVEEAVVDLPDADVVGSDEEAEEVDDLLAGEEDLAVVEDSVEVVAASKALFSLYFAQATVVALRTLFSSTIVKMFIPQSLLLYKYICEHTSRLSIFYKKSLS